jgi:hypothetical protein
MLIDKAKHLYKLKYNKLDSQHNPGFFDADIDELLYEALLDYIEIFYSGNNFKQFKFGFEVTQQRLDMLESFVTPYSLTSPSSSTEFDFNKFSFTLPTDYLHNIRAFSTHSCGDFIVSIETHDRINKVLLDSFKQPNKGWKRSVGIINNNMLHAYSDVTLDNIKGEYIKVPQKPFSGTYNSIDYLNGDSDAYKIGDDKVDLEIPDKYGDIVIDMAVQNTSGILSDYNHAQYLNNKLQTNT